MFNTTHKCIQSNEHITINNVSNIIPNLLNVYINFNIHTYINNVMNTN